MKTLAGHGLRSNVIALLLHLFLLSVPDVWAGGLWLPAGARQAGLNYCSVALTGFWSVENNLAGMADVKSIAAGTGYQNRFLVPHLGTADFAVIYPAKFGNMGMSMRYFGYALYHEMKIGLAYARAFGPKLRMGLQLDYVQTAFGDIYESYSNFTFALGVQSNVTDNLTLGIYVYNPVPVKLAGYANEKIPIIFRFGLAYWFSENLLVTSEVEKNTDVQPVILRGGMEYRYKKQFFFRAGFGTSGDVFSFGFGWHLKKLQLDIASNLHQSLGFSPQTSLVFSF